MCLIWFFFILISVSCDNSLFWWNLEIVSDYFRDFVFACICQLSKENRFEPKEWPFLFYLKKHNLWDIYIYCDKYLHLVNQVNGSTWWIMRNYTLVYANTWGNWEWWNAIRNDVLCVIWCVFVCVWLMYYVWFCVYKLIWNWFMRMMTWLT